MKELKIVITPPKDTETTPANETNEGANVPTESRGQTQPCPTIQSDGEVSYITTDPISLRFVHIYI